MKVWLPYTAANSGSSVFMKRLALALQERGLEIRVQEFPHAFQYAPYLLSAVQAPQGASAVITNSWTGFAFHRAGMRSVCVEHLFVLDDAMTPYKSFAQRLFHERILRRYLKRSYRSADHVVAVSEYTAASLNDKFPDVEPSVIRNGVNLQFFEPDHRGDAFSGDRPFRIGFAGNLTFRKGADLLVPIMEQLGEGFELIHTGKSVDNVPDLLKSRIKVKGRLDPLQMRDFYRQCDVLLAPTRLEGLPLSVLEAQSCGVPVVTTNCASLPEAIENGKTGIICPVDNISDMVSAIQSIASSPSQKGAMAKASRLRMEEGFDFDRTVDAYVDLITRKSASG